MRTFFRNTILFTLLFLTSFNTIAQDRKAMFFNNSVINLNTLVGGVGATITNETLLAEKLLDVSAGDISNFSIDGSNNISCTINIPYSINASAFLSDTSITYFHDIDGHCTSVGISGFDSATNLTTVTLSSATVLSAQSFTGSGLIIANFPNVTILGTNVFRLCSSLQEAYLDSYVGGTTYKTFELCTSLTTIYMPLVQKAGFQFISGCTSLTTLSLPALTTVEFRGLWNAVNLVTLTAPNITATTGNNAISLAKVVTLNLPNLVSVAGTQCFNGSAAMTSIYMPLCTTLGATTGDNSTFLNIKLGCTITVAASLATANGGSPDGDLVYASGTRSCTIIYN